MREDIFDPRPPPARGANVHAPAESPAEALEAFVHDVDTGEGGAVERRVALGTEGSDSEYHGEDSRQLGRKRDALVDVGVDVDVGVGVAIGGLGGAGLAVKSSMADG